MVTNSTNVSLAIAKQPFFSGARISTVRLWNQTFICK